MGEKDNLFCFILLLASELMTMPKEKEKKEKRKKERKKKGKKKKRKRPSLCFPITLSGHIARY